MPLTLRRHPIRSLTKGRPFLLPAGAVIGFVIVLTGQVQPADPEARLPDQFRLAGLIQRQQRDNEGQRGAVATLRDTLDEQRNSTASLGDDMQARRDDLARVGASAGTVAVKGLGFTVSLDDSSLERSPTGNVNDLVIHSQDVQAVVNALWGAGAEAVAINGQRLVSTSAPLCVGNTLLINGTVHSPPYEMAAIGADRSRFAADPLVGELREAAERFSLGWSVTRTQAMTIPAYDGATVPKYAQAVTG